jgi:hypothetical protein
MTATYEANQSAYPNNPSQLWRQSNPVHHIVDDPNTIPLDLAARLIHIITTKGGSDSVDHAWALLHLENALHNPANQMTHHFFSFFWQQHNQPPEYPYTPHMEISNDFLPTAPEAPHNTGSAELFPEYPFSTCQKNLDHLLFTFGYLIEVPDATLHLSLPTFETLKPATYPFHLQMEPQSS